MITTYSQLTYIRQAAGNKKIVFKGGCFDVIHEGHVRGLNYCKSLGDILIIGIVSDERVRQRKGPNRPVHVENDRMVVVDAFKPVDYVFLMPPSVEGQPTPTMQVLSRLRPDYFVEHVSGQDRYEQQGTKELAELGIELVLDPGFKRDSTSDIMRRIIG